jgi:hypothetical protein
MKEAKNGEREPKKISISPFRKSCSDWNSFSFFTLVVEARSYNNQQNEQYDDQYESGASITATAVAVAAAAKATIAHSSSPHFLLLNSNICKAYRICMGEPPPI